MKITAERERDEKEQTKRKKKKLLFTTYTKQFFA